MRNISLIILISILSTTLSAQSFENLYFESVSGKEVKLSEYAMDLTLLIFVSKNCPYSKYYKERITQLSQKYSGRIGILLVNSNISEFGKGNPYEGSQASYLYDTKQTSARILKAKRAPEAFVLKKTGNQYDVVYSGAIDDSPQLASDVRENYITDVLDALLAGKESPIESTRPTGCMIRFN